MNKLYFIRGMRKKLQELIIAKNNWFDLFFFMVWYHYQKMYIPKNEYCDNRITTERFSTKSFRDK